MTLSLPFFKRLLLPRNVKQRLTNDQTLHLLHQRQFEIARQANLDKPIAETRFVIMDTETTGFHAYSGDEIVSIAMLEYQGLQATDRIYNTLVNPGRNIPEESRKIHGISDQDVADAPSIETVLPAILEFIDDAVIVGHHIQFDIRFLNKTLKPYIGITLQNAWLDTMLLFLAHEKRLGHYHLEEVAEFCGIDIQHRHTALGDAQAAGACFCHLARMMADESDPVFLLRNQQVKKSGL